MARPVFSKVDIVILTVYLVSCWLLWVLAQFVLVIITDNFTHIEGEVAVTMLKAMLETASVLLGFWGLTVVYFLNSIRDRIERLEKQGVSAKTEMKKVQEPYSHVKQPEITSLRTYVTSVDETITRLEKARPSVIVLMVGLVIAFSLALIMGILSLGLAEAGKLEPYAFLLNIWMFALVVAGLPAFTYAAYRLIFK